MNYGINNKNISLDCHRFCRFGYAAFAEKVIKGLELEIKAMPHQMVLDALLVSH